MLDEAGWKDWEELGRIESNGKGLCRVASFDRGPMFHKDLKGQMMMIRHAMFMNSYNLSTPGKTVQIKQMSGFYLRLI